MQPTNAEGSDLEGDSGAVTRWAEKLLRQMGQEGATTVMLGNLPRHVTQRQLLEKLTETGFTGKWDFLYMPSTVDTGVGKGFAFINFSCWAGLQAFVRMWHGKRFFFHMGTGDSSLCVAKAALQGREANVQRWGAPHQKRVRNPMLRPIVPQGAACDVMEEFEAQCKDFERSERERGRPSSEQRERERARPSAAPAAPRAPAPLSSAAAAPRRRPPPGVAPAPRPRGPATAPGGGRP